MTDEDVKLIQKYLAPWLDAMLKSDQQEPAEEDSDGEQTESRVNRMLACARMMETVWGATQDAPAGDSGGQPLSQEDAAPRRFGRFKILRELGQGGCGIVYLAFDPALQREVALKIPQPRTLATDQSKPRFLREAQAAGLLDHANIVPVFEVSEAGPLCYIASAFCGGPTLSQWLRRRKTPVEPRLAAQLTATLAEAIHHAHSRGVLHRDLKPSNVLSVPVEEGQNGFPLGEERFTPKVSDFGMAAIASQSSDLTVSGSPFGTVNYMAPEQAQGRTAEISTATDVYGLGAILYQMLTQRTPLSGKNDLETLQRIRDEDPVAPSKLNLSIPRDLDAICLKCLEKEPSKRYDSAHALQRDLERFLEGSPIQARPISSIERVLRAVYKAPALAALVTLVTIVLITAIVGQAAYSTWLAEALATNRAEKQRADQAVEKLIEQRKLAQAARRKAEQGELQARRLLYASDMRRAIEAWRMQDTSRALQLLAAQHPAGPEAPDLRDFVWHFLNNACRRSPELAFDHGAPVTDCQATQDGKLLITTAEDGLIRFWDLTERRLVDFVRAHFRAARVIAMAPDGEAFVSGGDDGMVCLWSTTTRRPMKPLGFMNSGVESVAWSPDGRWIAAGARYSEFRVWSAAGELVLQVDNDHRHESLVFSPNGDRLYAPTREHIAVWNLETGLEEPHIDTGVLNNVRALCLFGDGRFLAANDRFHTAVAVIDRQAGEVVRYLRGGVEYIQHLIAVPDGEQLVSVAPDGAVRLLSLHQTFSEPIRTSVAGSFSAHAGSAVSACVVDEDRLATVGEDGFARVWRLNQIPNWRRLVQKRDMFSASYDPKSDTIITAIPFYEARPAIIDMKTGRPQPKSMEEGGFAASRRHTVSPDKRWCAIGGRKGEVAIWNLQTKAVVARLEGLDEEVADIDFSPQGQSLAACVQEFIVVWRTDGDWSSENARQWRQLRCPGAFDLQFSPRNERLAACAPDRNLLTIWNLRSNETVGEIQGPFARHGDIAFSPSGEEIAAICTDHRIRMWSADTGKLLATTDAYSASVVSIAFSPDGSALASGHDDGSIRFWHLPSSQSLGVVYRSLDVGAGIHCITFLPTRCRILATMVGENRELVISNSQSNAASTARPKR